MAGSPIALAPRPGAWPGPRRRKPFRAGASRTRAQHAFGAFAKEPNERLFIGFAGGQFQQIDAAATDFEISFSDDSSGVLAALGINTFFSGANATDISVNNAVAQNPGLIAAAQGHVKGDNRTALALSDLRDQAITQLNGVSLLEFWSQHVQDYATLASQTKQQLEADVVVRENLEAKQQAISGVNADEEAINLLLYQRAYQGNARFISVVDELLQTLISLL